MTPADTIATAPVRCPVCDHDEATEVGRGVDIFQDLRGDFCMVQCGHCTHVYMQPQPLPSELGKLYPSDYYAYVRDRDSKSSLPMRTLSRAYVHRNTSRMRRLAKRHGIDGARPVRIVDIGCGDGTRLSYWKEVFPDARTFGCDLSPSAVEAARARGHEVVCCGYEDLNLPLGTFDIVHAYDVIEHVAKPVDFLRAAARWSKPGGIVVITTPDYDSLDRKLFRGAWGVYGWVHWQIFNAASFARAAAAANLEVVHHAHYPRATSWIWSCNAALTRAGFAQAAEVLFPAKGGSTVVRPSPWSVALLTYFTAVDYASLALTKRTSDAEYVLRPAVATSS